MRPVIRAAAAAILSAAALWGQSILLDKPVKAGELTLFPDVNDGTAYYYVSDKPRLATDENGAAQFSFLRYVENTRSTSDQPEAREGSGGGLVHALVSLSVTPDQLREAGRELQRVNPGARIQGPVVYRSGKFALVSSFKDADGKMTAKVVGLGNAPILDGEKAAVSMLLTKDGAKLLWESFKTAAPDISFSFEMDVAGYRAPHRALIEANFDQIYEHQGFAAGIASTYLAAEIKGAFDDLMRTGAIKITQVGGDEKMEALVTTAYNKLAEMMFSPLGGTGTPSITNLAGAAGETSLLDRATAMLAKNREEARRENERIRAENRGAADRANRGTAASGGTAAGGAAAGGSAAAGGNRPAAAGGAEGAPRNAGSLGVTVPSAEEASRPNASHEEGLARERARAGNRRTEETVPSFAIVASYEMKKFRQRGQLKIDLNKYTADRMTLRFDENIGDMSQLAGDTRHFRQIDMNDPLYAQREISVMLDGLNASDFGNYINFVAVNLRKRYARGEDAADEVRITRTNFNKEGNAFRLLYGRKDLDDPRNWMQYEHKATWNFFGGRQVETPWQRAQIGEISLTPPYLRKTIEVQADPAAIAEAQVRAISVRVFFSVEGVEQSRTVTLTPAGNRLSDKVDVLVPLANQEFSYDVVWRMRDDTTVSAPRRTTSETILFVDRPPRG